jgi:hypothetical protein
VTINYAQTDRFVDENDHMIGGYFLLNGKKLYQDISVVHQPLVYYYSSLGQKIFKVNSIFSFINRQRLMILVYSLFWNLLFFIVFGPVAFLFTFIFEITKFWFLGNLLLAESLAIYPLVFLFCLVVKKILLKTELKLYELLMFSTATFITTFLLLQLWPTIFLLNLAMLFSYRKEIKKNFYLLIPFFGLTVILFIFVPFKYYIQEVFIYNFRYYLPYMDKISTLGGYIKMVFLPLTSFHKNFNSMELIIILFIFIYGYFFYFFWKKKNFLAFIFLIFCLISVNNRGNIIQYHDFHLLPWLGVYLFFPIILLPLLFKKQMKVKPLTLIFITGIVLLTIIFVNFFAQTPFMVKKNVLTENDINFHDINKYGLAIKAIRKPGDRLIAIPSDNLIHWVSGTDLATRQIEYYGWQYSIKEDKNRLINVFKNHPAEFVVNGDSFNSLPPFIKSYLDEKYVQIKEQNKPSRLFILKAILSRVTQNQWKDFQYLLFEKPKSL